MPRGSQLDRVVVAGPWTRALNDALDGRTIAETELRTASNVIVDVAGRVQRRPTIRVLSAGALDDSWQVRRIVPINAYTDSGTRHRDMAVLFSDGTNARIASLDLNTSSGERLDGLDSGTSRWGLVDPSDEVSAKDQSDPFLTGDVAVITDPTDESQWYAYACWAGNRWRRKHGETSWTAFTDTQATTTNDDYADPNDLHASGDPAGGFPYADVIHAYSVGDKQWMLAARGGILQWSHLVQVNGAELSGPQDWSPDDYAVFDDPVTAIAQHADLLLVFTAQRVWISPAVEPSLWQFTLLSAQRGAHAGAVVSEGPAGVAFFDVRTETLQVFDGGKLVAPLDGRHIFRTEGAVFAVGQTPRHIFVACGDDPVDDPADDHAGTTVWDNTDQTPQSMFVLDTTTGGLVRWNYGATALVFMDTNDGVRVLLGAPAHDDPIRTSGGDGGPCVASLWDFTRGEQSQSEYDEILTSISGSSPYTADGEAEGLSVVARVETRRELPDGWGSKQRWRGARVVADLSGLPSVDGGVDSVGDDTLNAAWVVEKGVEPARDVMVESGRDARMMGCPAESPEASVRLDWSDPSLRVYAVQLRHWRSGRRW